MKIYLNLMLCIILSSCGMTQAEPHQSNQKRKILIVLSNAGYYGNSNLKTANHFEETVVPFDVFVSAGYEVDFVSPNGGKVPLGYIDTSVYIMAKYINDHAFMDKISRTKRPSEIDASEYGVIFYSGGGAAMFGVPEDKAIQKIAMSIYEQNDGVVSSICHGTAGLVNLKTSDGNYLVEGKRVNGFPDMFEDMEADYYKQFPFSIQEKIKKRKGDFVYAEEWGAKHYVVDGRLATGQDPSSAKDLAIKIVEMLEGLNQ